MGVCGGLVVVVCAVAAAALPAQNPKAAPIGKFWQVTDIHWDQQYSETGDPLKMCHDNYPTDLTSGNLTTDSPRDHSTGQYGNYLCDSPWKLVKSALGAMANIETMPDFILWTGDNVPHTNDPEPDFSVIFRTVNNLTTELRSTFPPHVPIVPVLGNHDAFPKDYYPVAGEEFYGRYLQEGGWALVLPEDAQEDFRKGGYYQTTTPAGVKVVVLNTNLYYAFNRLGTGAQDPCGQFAWLEDKLEQAKNAGEKVIIAAHAPPGYFERFPVIPFFNATYNDNYVDLLNRYGEVIMAQIYGHEHTDSFRVFVDDEGELQSVAFLAPSITPWYPAPVPGGTAINPSLRLYHYNTSNILDYTQYYLNLTQYSPHSGQAVANFGVENKNNLNVENKNNFGASSVMDRSGVAYWKELYRARDLYDLEVLDVVNMRLLYERLVNDDSLFQTYFLMNSAGYNDGYCNATCKNHQLCALVTLKVHGVKPCMPHDTHHHPMSRLYADYGYDFSQGDSNHMVVVVVALGMTLMVVLGVALFGVMVLVVLQRHNLLGVQKAVPVENLGIGVKQQGYKSFA